MRSLHTIISPVLLSALFLMSCESQSINDAAPAASDSVAVLTEYFETERNEADNVDSPAIWHGPDDRHWLITTAKEADVLLVHDATDGTLLQRVGGEGAGAGEFERPNGIAVVEDLAIVVERDNRRVQVFSLPDFESLGFFGQDRLVMPYGVAAVPHEEGGYDLFVTDNYEDPGELIPPDSMLGERVHLFRFTVENGSLNSEHTGNIGPTSGDGVLRVVESIYADPANNRLLIAEEEDFRSHIKVFTMEGEFTGQVLDQSFFPNQAEGIALYSCGELDGYWISTDQGEASNTFHLFDRRTLEHVGSFAGETTMNTDGIVLTQRGFGPFPNGALFTVHDDQSITAFSWTDIATALDLQMDCNPEGA